MDADALANDLIQDEGLRLTAYADSEGYWTIGVGRLIDGRKNGGITEDEARYLLKNDILRVVADLDRALPWWRSRPDHVQLAMANMCFQLGIHGLQGFKIGLACLQAGDYAGARAAFLDSQWAKQTPNRAARVTGEFRA